GRKTWALSLLLRSSGAGIRRSPKSWRRITCMTWLQEWMDQSNKALNSGRAPKDLNERGHARHAIDLQKDFTAARRECGDARACIFRRRTEQARSTLPGSSSRPPRPSRDVAGGAELRVEGPEWQDDQVERLQR